MGAGNPQDTRIRPQLEWTPLILAAVVLLIYVYYTASFLFFTPYPGFSFTSTAEGWVINDAGENEELEVNALITRIGELTAADAQQDRRLAPFRGYDTGDTVSLLVRLPEAQEATVVSLTIPAPTIQELLRRVVATLAFFPFWIVGTAALLLLQPRDVRWRLLVGFMYLIAIWVIAGAVSAWRIPGSRAMLGVSALVLVPIAVHLHLIVPYRLFEKAHPIVLLALYGVFGIFTVFEVFDSLPSTLLVVSAPLMFASIILILTYRLLRPGSSSERFATGLMLAGISLSFGPGILMYILPSALGFGDAGIFGTTLAFLAIPILPLFYTYTIYKKQLGAIEFRANRLLSFYSFALVYSSVFLIVLLLGQRALAGGTQLVFLLIVSTAFVMTAPSLYEVFQSWVNKLAYGTDYDPEEIMRRFANEIPSALNRDALTRLLINDIAPSLLIRQSALYLFDNDDAFPLYHQGVEPLPAPLRMAILDGFLARPNQYLPPGFEAPEELVDWVRLAVPLTARERITGIWLLGRRDPDDFYPRNDIELLQSLANQLAPVIENIELYEALQDQADNLAAEVARRTSELEAEKDRTQTILDSAGEGIFFMAPDGEIRYSNPTLSHMTGYSPNDLRTSAFELLSPSGEEEEDPLGALTEAMATGRAWSGELMLRQQGGATLEVDLTLSPTQDGSRVTGFVGVVKDVSQQKEIDRLKSNIISNVSHELKTPLTNFKTYLTLLRRGREEKREQYLSVLDQESDKLTQLVGDLLTLSQLEALQTTLSPVDVRLMISSALQSVATKARKKSITIQADLPEGLPLVLADEKQFDQVLVNLLANAVNYTPDGGRVEISTGRSTNGNGDDVWISVSDTGYGIEPGELPSIFERFYRGTQNGRQGAPGTGLGLAICKEIVDRHQGHIAVESEVGQGSRFTVFLKAEAARP